MFQSCQKLYKKQLQFLLPQKQPHVNTILEIDNRWIKK